MPSKAARTSNNPKTGSKSKIKSDQKPAKASTAKKATGMSLNPDEDEISYYKECTQMGCRKSIKRGEKCWYCGWQN